MSDKHLCGQYKPAGQDGMGYGLAVPIYKADTHDRNRDEKGAPKVGGEVKLLSLR